MGFVRTGLLYFPSYLFPVLVAFIKVTSHMKILFSSDCIVFLVQRQTASTRPDAVKGNLNNVNYKWKNTTLLSATHNEEDTKREGI